MVYSLSQIQGQPWIPWQIFCLYNDECDKKYKVYTDMDSDGKTEIITDINCTIAIAKA